MLQVIPNINPLQGRIDRNNLLLGSEQKRGENVRGQIPMVVQIGFLGIIPEAAEFMRPLRNHLLHLARSILLHPGNAKESLEIGHGGEERLGSASEEIEGDDPLFRPGVEGNVGFEEDADAGYSSGEEGVAVVGEHGEAGIGDAFDHGVREAGFGVEEGRFDVFDVDQEVLAGGEVGFGSVGGIGADS